VIVVCFRRAGHSSRGVLLIVVCLNVIVNLDSGETLTHWGLLHHGGGGWEIELAEDFLSFLVVLLESLSSSEKSRCEYIIWHQNPALTGCYGLESERTHREGRVPWDHHYSLILFTTSRTFALPTEQNFRSNIRQRSVWHNKGSKWLQNPN
jgi:hypothetical protein